MNRSLRLRTRKALKLITDKALELFRYPAGAVIRTTSCTYIAQADGSWRKIIAVSSPDPTSKRLVWRLQYA